MRLPLLFLLLLLSARFPAQGYGFRHYSVNDGLAQSMVTSACEDSEGFLWFGTQEGLCRYDGYTFRTFRHEAGNRSSLADNYVLAVFEDSHRRLWIACREGISRYDRTSGQFVTVSIRGLDPFGPRTYFIFREIPGGTIEGCSNGLLFTETNDSTLTFIPGDGNLPFRFTGMPASPALPLSDSSTAKTGTIYFLAGKFRAHAFTDGPNGTSWLSTGTTLYSFDAGGKTIASVPLPSGSGAPAALLVDAAGRLWVGCRNGLYLFTNSAWKKITTPGAPVGETISSLYEDKKGWIWIGTNFAGLYSYDPRSEVFAHPGPFIVGEPLSSKIVWSFCQPNQYELWVGTAKGINVLSTLVFHTRWSGVLSDYAVNNGSPAGLDELNDKVVTAMLITGDTIWIGTSGFGLYAYDQRSGKIIAHYHIQGENGKAIGNDHVYCLARDNNNVYAGTQNGIAAIDRKNFSSQMLMPQKLTGKKNSNYIMSLYTGGNVLWAGTSSGLFRYDLVSKNCSSYVHDENDTSSLPNNFVTCITPHPSKANIFYLGTMGAGIAEFDPGKKTFRAYATKEGVTGSTVYGILFDDKERLWASTNDGIALLNLATGVAEMFTTKDGIGFPEFSQNAWFKAPAGDLFFGSTQEFVCFFPDSVKLPERLPRLALASISINYQPVAPHAPNIHGSISKPEKIELWPGDRVLTVEFIGAGVPGGRNYHYAYRLSGFDEEWVVPANGLRMASYTNLPPGEYQLEIRASVRADGSFASVYQLPVIVYPPFYSTWWFRSLAALVIAGAGIYIVRYFSQRRLREKLREMQTQKRIQEERERISRDLHDNVGAQLTYIISTLDNVSWKMTKPGNEAESKQKLERLGDQARNTMQQLRESIWAINSTSVTADELSLRTQEFMQQLAENHEHVKWEVRRRGTAMTLTPSLAIQLFRIVQEAVSNAFRHSGGDDILVIFTTEQQEMVISITDNGKGFDTSETHAGHYGLKNMPARAQQIGAAFEIRSVPGEGTVIRIALHKLVLSSEF